MKAGIANGIGGPDFLQISNIEIPTIKGNDVLIKITAAGINQPDIIHNNYCAIRYADHHFIVFIAKLYRNNHNESVKIC